jgi:hypothetical protein
MSYKIHMLVVCLLTIFNVHAINREQLLKLYREANVRQFALVSSRLKVVSVSINSGEASVRNYQIPGSILDEYQRHGSLTDYDRMISWFNVQIKRQRIRIDYCFNILWRDSLATSLSKLQEREEIHAATIKELRNKLSSSDILLTPEYVNIKNHLAKQEDQYHATMVLKKQIEDQLK